MTIRIREATAADLPIAYEVQREASVAAGMEIGNVVGPAGGQVPAKFRHELNEGRFLVAEENGHMLGFGAVFQRANVAFLATFYVRPGAQTAGQGVGQRLIDALFDGLGPIRSVVSSHVHRALAIYARNGMLPRWPLYMLAGPSDRILGSPGSDLCVRKAEWDDPDLVAWDAGIAGRDVRPVDHRYWREEYCADPYWIFRDDQPVGYACIQKLYRSPDAPWNPDVVAIGPVGVRDQEDAPGVVMAIAGTAASLAATVKINVPGAHRSLPLLLDAGFRIQYQATYCSSSAADIFDPQRYIPADTITL